MFKNYLLVAGRNLLRSKAYSAINITGLAIGLAVCMLIVLYVGHETSYDRFHKNSDRIYWLRTKLKLGGDSVFMPYLNYSAAPQAKSREQGIESYLRIRQEPGNVIISNTQHPSLKFAESKFIFADSNFFNFFSFKLLQGNKQLVLQRPLSVVITRNAAKKYFGNEDAVGKTLRYNNSYDLLVTGVAENAPSNSTIGFEFIASLSSLSSMTELRDLVLREKNDFTTYFLLKPEGNISRVESTLLALATEKEKDAAFNIRYISTPLAQLHVTSVTDSSNLRYLDVFPFVAALVLVLALINYMSLSTARAATRAKEIGVRKVLGAGRHMIATQFFIESAMYTTISFLLAYGLCSFFQPLFFNFLQIEVDHSFFYHPMIAIAFAVLFIVTVLVAGTYPSLLLSAYRPVAVLYGKLKKGGSISMRKFFTVLQFSIAVAFIICGIVIQRQLYYFRHTDTGMNRENVVMIPFGKGVTRQFAAFRNEVSSVPGVVQSSLALHPLYKGYDVMGITPRGSNEMMLIPTLDVDQHFISLLDLKWKLPPVDSFFYLNRNNVILNEAAVEKLNLESDMLNQKVDQFEVAGVLKDFNWASLQSKIDALLLSVSKDTDSTSLWARKGGCLFLRIGAHSNIPAFMGRMRDLHKRYDNENPFEYYFMDDAFDALYKGEERLSVILNVFTLLAILIACLGLVGLITFIVIRRTKEIGIRKTLGASVRGIVGLLSGEFVLLVAIATVIASPVAWYFMDKWLQNFAYRIELGWTVFVIAGVAAILIAMFTVGFQALKAAMANPVKSLRVE